MASDWRYDLVSYRRFVEEALAEGGGPNEVGRRLFQARYGSPERRQMDNQRLRWLAALQALAQRTVAQGPGAVAEAALMMLARRGVGDPATPAGQQDAQRRVQNDAVGMTAAQIRTALGAAQDDLRIAESATEIDGPADTEDWNIWDDEDDDGGGGGVLAGGPDLSWQWRCEEWQRLLAVVTEGGHGVYEPGIDTQSLAWADQAQELLDRQHAAAQTEQAARDAQRAAEDAEWLDRLEVGLFLDAAVGRRIRAWAEHYEVTVEDVIVHLLQHAADGPAGGITVAETRPAAGAGTPPRRAPHYTTSPASPWNAVDRRRWNRYPSTSSEDYHGPPLDW